MLSLNPPHAQLAGLSADKIQSVPKKHTGFPPMVNVYPFSWGRGAGAEGEKKGYSGSTIAITVLPAFSDH